MIVRIASVAALPDFMLSVVFDDGKRVLYDVKEDMRDIPSYRVLCQVPGLFPLVRLDESRTCLYWNSEIDLSSDSVYKYGHEITG